jgi:hypothetical protein
MKKIVLIAFSLLAVTASAQTFNAGIRIQKTHKMYWENGFSLQYSFKDFQPDRLYIGLDYVTSRLGSAIGSNALKQDNYIVSGTWFFKDPKPFRFNVRLNVGYFYADYEVDIFEDVPNTAFLFSPEIGINYTFKELPISLNLGSGYYVDFAKEGYSPGTLQPLYYHFDVYYTIFKTKTNE